MTVNVTNPLSRSRQTGFGKGEGDGLPRKVALGSQLGLPQNVQRRGNCATLLTVVIK